MDRHRIRRTPNSGPPPGLLFGELAYSDADQQLHVGRVNSALPPAKFGASPTDYGPAIADLEQGLADTGESLAVIQLNQLTQAATLETLTSDVASLEATQDTQDTAIAFLNTTQAAQDSAIAALGTTAGGQATALATLTTSDAAQDAAIAANSSAIAANAAAIAAINTGWNYIGPTEPTSPAVGFTWWERSSGLTLGRWFWTGSLWADIEISSDRSGASFSLSATNSLATSNIVISPRQNAGGVLLERFALTFWATDLVVSITDDWLFTASMRGANSAAGSVAALFNDAKLSDQITGIAGAFITYSFVRNFSVHSPFAFNSAVSSPVLCRVGATKLNAAPTLNACLAHLFWRYTR